MSPAAALRNMPFREKTAWAMASILIGGAAFYLNMVISASRALGQTAPPVVGFVIAYVVVIVIASGLFMSALAAASPREANAPADEREKIIGDKAGNWSGYVMVVPALGALWHYAVNMDGNMLFHLAFLSLMLGQIAEYVFQIVLYRRGG
jgi:ABC-type transport system involved in multi-copper enzyme maturation permease subunit